MISVHQVVIAVYVVQVVILWIIHVLLVQQDYSTIAPHQHVKLTVYLIVHLALIQQTVQYVNQVINLLTIVV